MAKTRQQVDQSSPTNSLGAAKPVAQERPTLSKKEEMTAAKAARARAELTATRGAKQSKAKAVEPTKPAYVRPVPMPKEDMN